MLLLWTLRGPARQLAFLSINLVFVGGLVLGAVGTVSTIAFVALGYGLTRLAVRRNTRLWLPIGVYVALFIYMRRYDFLTWLVADDLLTTLLRTIGLSFVLFKVLHVMVDGRSGRLGRFDPLTYVNYCLNFTTFMMGPIQRYQDYREQWDGEKEAVAPDFEAHLDQVLRIVIGLVKVYVLGVWFQGHALRPDTDLLSLSVLALLIQSYAFYFYLYMNFSGYCDVVIGVGSLFGVRPPENFRFPFIARNISDFWLRQHRSLTLWLTDYVFTPCYKSLLSTRTWRRRPILAAHIGATVTMLISGLWHGTTMSFFLFGVVHGLWFVVYRSWDAGLTRWLGKDGAQRFRRHWLVHAAAIVITFNATALAFVFFQVSPEGIRQVMRTLT